VYAVKDNGHAVVTVGEVSRAKLVRDGDAVRHDCAKEVLYVLHVTELLEAARLHAVDLLHGSRLQHVDQPGTRYEFVSFVWFFYYFYYYYYFTPHFPLGTDVGGGGTGQCWVSWSVPKQIAKKHKLLINQ